jgi:hypothetical protein
MRVYRNTLSYLCMCSQAQGGTSWYRKVHIVVEDAQVMLEHSSSWQSMRSSIESQTSDVQMSLAVSPDLQGIFTLARARTGRAFRLSGFASNQHKRCVKAAHMSARARRGGREHGKVDSLQTSLQYCIIAGLVICKNNPVIHSM